MSLNGRVVQGNNKSLSSRWAENGQAMESSPWLAYPADSPLTSTSRKQSRAAADKIRMLSAS
jgi:hypothetical protein